MCSIIIDLSPTHKAPGEAEVLCTKLVIYLFTFLIRAPDRLADRKDRQTDERTEIGLQRMLIFFFFTFHHNLYVFFFACRQVAIFVIVAAFVNLIN